MYLQAYELDSKPTVQSTRHSTSQRTDPLTQQQFTGPERAVLLAAGKDSVKDALQQVEQV